MIVCHSCILRRGNAFGNAWSRLFSLKRSRSIQKIKMEAILNNSPSCHFSLQMRKDTRRNPSAPPSVPRTIEEEQQRLNSEPAPISNTKQLKIAIIGPPNCGKSTLINQLVGWRICSVSSKVQTTVCNSSAILTEGDTQLVFLDTPGMVTNTEIKRFKLKEALVAGPENSLQMADLIAILHDVSNRYTRGALHPLTLRLLSLYPHIPSILIFNKIDLLKSKKNILLDVTRSLTCGLVGGSEINLLKSNEQRDKTKSQLMQKFLPKDEERLVPLSSSSSLETQIPDNEDIGFIPEEASPSPSQTPPADSMMDTRGYSLPDLLGPQIMEGISDEDVYEGRVKLTEAQVHLFIKDKIGWPKFEDVFMISALKGMGVEDLRDYLLANASSSPWNFTSDVVTDQSPQDIALMTVREKCLEYLPNNIPYELKFRIDNWELSESEVLSLLISIHCINSSAVKLIVGAKGSTVQRIAAEAENHLRSTFRSEVRLRLNVATDKTLKRKKKTPL